MSTTSTNTTMRAEAAQLLHANPQTIATLTSELPAGVTAQPFVEAATTKGDAWMSGEAGYWHWQTPERPSDEPLAGTVALVTGAASGLGKAVALSLLAAVRAYCRS